MTPRNLSPYTAEHVVPRPQSALPRGSPDDCSTYPPRSPLRGRVSARDLMVLRALAMLSLVAIGSYEVGLPEPEPSPELVAAGKELFDRLGEAEVERVVGDALRGVLTEMHTEALLLWGDIEGGVHG
jgi:hypothetical protein